MFKIKRLPLLLSLVALIICACSKGKHYETNVATPVVRTITAKRNYYNSYLNCYKTYDIKTEDNLVSFCGTTPATEEFFDMFDNVAYSNVKNYGNYTVEIYCSFDFLKFEFCYRMSVLNKNNKIIDGEAKITGAFVTSLGDLDANLNIESEAKLLSEYRKNMREASQNNVVDDCSILLLLIGLSAAVTIAATAYVVVAEITEQEQAKKNYEDNKELERNGDGVDLGNYITRQTEESKLGYKSSKYKFGFAEFSNVGCEIASAYNASIAFGKAEMLSDTIHFFETFAIEISVGFGYLGSNPKEIYRYLNHKRINYHNYTKIKQFENELSSLTTARAIVSFWNKGGLISGLHTFYLEKTSAKSLYAYNMEGDSIPEFCNDFAEIKNNFSGFIVGYFLQ